MSSDIIYNKNFIKIDENLFLPFILCGSSNCYDAGGSRGKERRSRSWWNDKYIMGGKHMASKEEILSRIMEIRENLIKRDEDRKEEDKYNDKHFGWFSGISFYGKSTSGTTFGMFKSFYLTGIKKAHTVEQMKKYGISISIDTYVWDKKETEEKIGKPLLEKIYINSTEELLQAYNKFNDYYNGLTDVSWNFHMDCGYDENRLKKMRKEERKENEINVPKKEKSELTLPCYFVVRVKSYGKLIKFGSRRFTYSYQSDGGKKFKTEKEAIKWNDKFKTRFTSYDSEVEMIEKEKTFFV